MTKQSNNTLGIDEDTERRYFHFNHKNYETFEEMKLSKYMVTSKIINYMLDKFETGEIKLNEVLK